MKYIGTGTYATFVEQMNKVFFALTSARITGKNIKQDSIVKLEERGLVISIR